MSRVGFEPTTPVSERAKTVHALDSAETWNIRGMNHKVDNNIFMNFPFEISY
jgi:hypothetical protein